MTKTLAWCQRTTDEATLAWVAYLDVDVIAAQEALRRPLSERGWPPVAQTPTAPQKPAGGPDSYVRPADRPEPPKGPRPESLVAPEGKELKGAYARRAKKETP